MATLPIDELAPGVYAIDTAHVDGKVGLILGQRRGLQVDGGASVAEGHDVSRAIRDRGWTVEVLAYSHGHWDHVRGGRSFRGDEVIAHADALAGIQKELAAADDETPPASAEVPFVAGVPTLVTSGTLRLDLGDRDVALLDTPGHAPGAMCVFVPEEGILFGGDTAVTAIPPVFADGDSRLLEESLRGLAGLAVEVLVPGHGAVVRGRSAVVTCLLWAADYLARVRDHVARGLPHQTPDEVVARATFRAFVGDRLPTTRHRMEWRHEQTVRGMIRELGDQPGLQ